jgi:hypothetical protein
VYLFWVAYQVNGRRCVRIERAASLILARMSTALAYPDEGTFVEGYSLEDKMATRVPADMVGRELSQAEAQKLLTLFAAA